LLRFHYLRSEAINTVSERFYTDNVADYSHSGQRGRDACREDLAFHLEFLRPVLEFGLLQPMVDYLRWLATVLATRDIPVGHLSLSLDWFSEFFVANMGVGDAQIVAAYIKQINALFLQEDLVEPAIYGMMPEAWPESESFEKALLTGDRSSADALLAGCLQRGRGLLDAELHMIQPALYRIGHKWQNNLVSVAQEHLATAIAQAVMNHGLLQSQIPPSNCKRVVLACVEGNNHTVGLQMVADAFHLAGWDAQFLGANVPTSSLIRHLEQVKPELVGLSVSLPQQLRVVKDVMSRLTQSLGFSRPPVIIGGLAINQFNSLAGRLAADGWSPDARSAVTHASTLVTPMA
jgi:methanogenic corrinoid protein MtbC1